MLTNEKIITMYNLKIKKWNRKMIQILIDVYVLDNIYITNLDNIINIHKKNKIN